MQTSLTTSTRSVFAVRFLHRDAAVHSRMFLAQ